MRATALGVIVLLFLGCAQPQTALYSQKNLEAEKTVIDEQFQSIVARAQTGEITWFAAYQEYMQFLSPKFPNMDPWSRQYFNEMGRIALLLDQQAITFDEAALRLSDKQAQLEIERNAVLAQLDANRRAQQQADSTALMAMGLYFLQAAQPRYIPPASINCTSVQQGIFRHMNCR